MPLNQHSPSSTSHFTQRLASTWKPAHARADTFCRVVWDSTPRPSDGWPARLHSLSSKWTSPDRTRQRSSALERKGVGECRTVVIHWAHQVEMGKLISVKTAFKFKLLLILSLLRTPAVHGAKLCRLFCVKG